MKNVARRLRAEYPERQALHPRGEAQLGILHVRRHRAGRRARVPRDRGDAGRDQERGGRILGLSIAGYSLGEARGASTPSGCCTPTAPSTSSSARATAFASPLPRRAHARAARLGQPAVQRARRAHAVKVGPPALHHRQLPRHGGRPLLAVLADPKSVFMQRPRPLQACALHQHRQRPHRRALHDGHRQHRPSTPTCARCAPTASPATRTSSSTGRPWPAARRPPAGPLQPGLPRPRARFANNLPFVVALSVFLPMGVVAYLVAAAVQTVRSSKRIELHEKGLAGIDISGYRGVPLIIKEIRTQIEDAYEELNSSPEPGVPRRRRRRRRRRARDQGRRRLGGRRAAPPATETTLGDGRPRRRGHSTSSTASPDEVADAGAHGRPVRHDREPRRPRLAQYPVWIHKVRHSHAAIYRRGPTRSSFSEGELVLSHWVKEEFLL